MLMFHGPPEPTMSAGYPAGDASLWPGNGPVPPVAREKTCAVASESAYTIAALGPQTWPAFDALVQRQ